MLRFIFAPHGRKILSLEDGLRILTAFTRDYLTESADFPERHLRGWIFD